MRHTLTIAAALALFGPLHGAAIAQQQTETGDVGVLDQLKACRTIADPADRLACYDREVGSVLDRTEQGSLQVVDQKEVENARRRLFGLNIPKLKILGGDREEMESLVTTITSVRQINRETWTFITEEGSVWRITDAPMRFNGPKPGQSVEFKRAAMGTFFIRVNGQMGVKGTRVE